MKIKFIAALVFCVCLTACGAAPAGVTDAPAETASVQTERETETLPETEPETTEMPIVHTGTNPLTGEGNYPEAASGKRPAAVMVSNIRQSYPQYGIGAADMLYELPVEGGVTRMMAVYADYSAVPDVCSVRSARYYYPMIAMGMDAIYCHWGAEQNYAVMLMNDLGLDHFDGGKLMNSVLFYRDPERTGKYATEHTGYLRGSELPAAIEKYGIRTDRASDEAAFNFSEEARTPAENACIGAVLSFSDSSRTGFTYDAASQTYLMEHNGSPQIDGKTGQQLSYTNVFVLRTDVSYLEEDQYLRKVMLEGGSGYYISRGGTETIRWEKRNDTEPIRMYNAAGEMLTVNTGKSYIGVIGNERPVNLAAE